MNLLKAGSRPRVIAVFGSTRAEVERAVSHTRTAATGLPVWAWCAEACSEANSAIEGCDRLTVCHNASDFRKDLSLQWPALSIIAWTGHSGHAALKLTAFTVPPFRVLLFNEAGDFFPATPSWIAKHVKRRLKDAAIARLHAMNDLIRSAGFSTWSVALRSAQRSRDVFMLALSFMLRSARRLRDVLMLAMSFILRRCRRLRDVFMLGLSFILRGGRRLRDVFMLALSFALRTGQRLRDLFRLGLSLAWRTGQRIRDFVRWIPEALLALLGWAVQWTGPTSFFLVERIRHKQRLATHEGNSLFQVVKFR